MQKPFTLNNVDYFDILSDIFNEILEIYSTQRTYATCIGELRETDSVRPFSGDPWINFLEKLATFSTPFKEQFSVKV